jgi:hypothetical protein
MHRGLLLSMAVAVAVSTIHPSMAGDESEPKIADYAMIVRNGPDDYVLLLEDGTWTIPENQVETAFFHAYHDYKPDDTRALAQKTYAIGELRILRDTKLVQKGESGTEEIGDLKTGDVLLYDGITEDAQFFKITKNAVPVGLVPWDDAVPLVSICGTEGCITANHSIYLLRTPEEGAERILELEQGQKTILLFMRPMNRFLMVQVPDGPVGFVPFTSTTWTKF